MDLYSNIDKVIKVNLNNDFTTILGKF